MRKNLVNEQIKSKTVRLIGKDGKQVGIVPIDEALKVSQKEGLDLMQVSEEGNPPICKLLDYGQFVYQKKKLRKQSRRSQQITKELKLSPKISDHDYDVRLRQGLKFLKKKFKVKLTVWFRGREIVHQSLGEDVAKRYIEDVKEFGLAEDNFSRAGRTIGVIINPR